MIYTSEVKPEVSEFVSVSKCIYVYLVTSEPLVTSQQQAWCAERGDHNKK